MYQQDTEKEQMSLTDNKSPQDMDIHHHLQLSEALRFVYYQDIHTQQCMVNNLIHLLLQHMFQLDMLGKPQEESFAM